MKSKILATLSVIALGTLCAAPAHAGGAWSVSVSLGAPVYTPPVVAAPPVVVAAPVYAPPVAYCPPPVVYVPPVVCAPAVVYAPACYRPHSHYACPPRSGWHGHH
jgi:hypothetical protein